MAWVATIIVAVLLLAIIVIAATVEGIRIRAEMWELEVLRTSLPGREAVFPQSSPASPTVVAVPQSSQDLSALEAPFASLAADVLLRSGPGTEYASAADLSAGERVRLLAASISTRGEGWQLVRAAEGQVGWCLVEKLIPASAE
jgi:uncharacterized protein YgiM (DUF1202 family)